jgi:hypothetical protein
LNKVNLHDLRAHNRRLLIQAVVEGKKSSRITLAKDTGLSPSTVTTLVSELIHEGVLVESGVTISTAGRGRKELNINAAYGAIAVFEISRQRTGLFIFDMALEKKEEKTIAVHRLSGNTLFSEITSAVIDNFFHNKQYGPLAGIGLLFQEDMIESDLTVMFSTSLSADNISLREALYTQFKVSVIGEYSVNEILNHIAAPVTAKNSAHVTIANTILISIMIEGKPIKMTGGKSANITKLFAAFDNHLIPPDTPDLPGGMSLPARLADVLAFLCMLFPLDIIFVSRRTVKKSTFLFQVREALGRLLSPTPPPLVKLIEPPNSPLSEKMAVRMRRLILNIPA